MAEPSGQTPSAPRLASTAILRAGFDLALDTERGKYAAYKLTFLAAGGLLVGGALLLRYARRDKPGRTAGLAEREPEQLGEGRPAESGVELKMPDRMA